MALLSQDFTGGQTQVQSVTRPNLIKRILRETGYGQTGSCTSNGTTTTVIDTNNLQSTQFNDRDHVGAFLYFSSGSGDGHIATVTTYAPSTGTLTFSPAIAASGTNSGVVYHLFRTPFSPRVLLDSLDTLVTQEWWTPCLTFLSEAADYDMEQSGTTAWSNASNTTIAKTAWSLANHEGIFGSQALSVTNTAANGYATPTNPFRATPGNNYYFGIFFTPTDPTVAHTATFVIYDQSNSAAIETITTTSKTTVFIGTEVQAPSGCGLIQIRIGAQEDAVVGVFDELVAVDLQAYDMAMPWWVRNADQIKGVYRWESKQSIQGSNLYAPGWTGSKLQDFDYGITQFGSGGFRLLSESPIRGPLYVEGTRNEVAWASNTEAKRINENWAVHVLGAQLFDMMLSRAQKADTGPLIERKNTWQGQANREMEIAAYKTQRVRPSRTRWRSM